MLFNILLKLNILTNMFEKLRIITTRIFTPKPNIPLGRWRLKHDFEVWNNYLTNGYGEPGYPNVLKHKWIVDLEKKRKLA